jgi:hypothetical protein
MPAAIAAHNFRALHAKRTVDIPRDGARERVEKRRPAAAGLELVGRFVERSGAAGAGVDAGGGHVFVIYASVGCFGPFLAEDAELFWESTEEETDG